MLTLHNLLYINLAFVSLLISLGVEALKFDEDFFISTRNLADFFLQKFRSTDHNHGSVNDAAEYIAKQPIFCALSYPRQIP